MTAVESQSTHSPFRDSQPEPLPSRFTAVNGSSSLNGNGNSRKALEEHSHDPQRVTPPGKEKLTITTDTHREEWGHSNKPSQPPAPSSHESDNHSHKRKRSGSAERQDSDSTSSYHRYSGQSSNAVKDTGVGRTSPDTPYPDAAREASIRAQPQSMARSSYTAPQTPYSYAEDGRPTGSSWYSQQSNDTRSASDNQHSSISNNMSSDDHLREALQRENHGGGGGEPRSAYPDMSPEDDGEHGGTYGPYGQDRSALQLQADHKKRKRNFSNRTKTGCMTCRKRKKKCDEARPECQNCIRGGFICSGYPSRGQWPKSEQKQAPVPLQSKEGYDNTANPYPQPTYNPHTQHTSAGQKREPLPSYRGQQLRVDPQHPAARMEDDRHSAVSLPSASINSPDNRMSLGSYSQTGPFPTPVSANPPSAYPGSRLTELDYKRMPPLHDPARQEHEANAGQSQGSLPPPQISILHPSHSSSPHPHTPHSTTVQDAARLALSHPASRTQSQKERMLQGKEFYPFDRELVLERERCLSAQWRFNQSTNPSNGFLPENRAGLFREILQPKSGVQLSPTTTTPASPSGFIGPNVVVEAPFNCDYGYNIHLGKEVAIGKNCTILDACLVHIGDRCVLGPNVNIFTTTLPIDYRKRLGNRGPHTGKPVVIEEDCWIGGGVTILPGCTIQRGSTIGAASVITRNVPPFTVVAGNPARVLRGLNSEI